MVLVPVPGLVRLFANPPICRYRGIAICGKHGQALSVERLQRGLMRSRRWPGCAGAENVVCTDVV